MDVIYTRNSQTTLHIKVCFFYLQTITDRGREGKGGREGGRERERERVSESVYRCTDQHKKELYYTCTSHTTLLTNGGHNLTIQEREMFEKTLEWLHTVEGRQSLGKTVLQQSALYYMPAQYTHVHIPFDNVIYVHVHIMSMGCRYTQINSTLACVQ